MRLLLVLGGALALAACGAETPRPAAALPSPRVPVPVVAGLDRVMGQTSRNVVALLGAPRAEVQEGMGRKLQFAGPICVLDAYLYPPAAGREAVVTHIDARQRDGNPIDRASCLSALVKR